MPRPPRMLLVSALLLAVCVFGTYWLSALPGMREQHQAQTQVSPPVVAPVHVVVPRLQHRHARHSAARHEVATTHDVPSPAAMTMSAPQPLYAPPPPYPTSALRTHREGEVTLRLTLAPDGHVAAVSVIHSSGDRDLDRAADRGLSAWIFPPPSAGSPRSFDWPVRFQIDSHD